MEYEKKLKGCAESICGDLSSAVNCLPLAHFPLCLALELFLPSRIQLCSNQLLKAQVQCRRDSGHARRDEIRISRG